MLEDHFFVNSRGDWECKHCHTSALLFTSVRHADDCPAILEATQHGHEADASRGPFTSGVTGRAERAYYSEDVPF